MTLEIIQTSNGEKADELANRIVDLINEYNQILTGYELLGIIDVVRGDVHDSIRAMEVHG